MAHLRDLAACSLVVVAGALPGAAYPQAPSAAVTRSVAATGRSSRRAGAELRLLLGAGEYGQTSKNQIRGFDLTWRQIQPVPGSFDARATGRAYRMQLPSFNAQNADRRAFWMRLFASATALAPAWLPKQCRYTPVGPDDEKQRHVPIWDPCVWDKLRGAWRTLMIDKGLRSDPRLKFVYVPGAFTWAEFDYEMIDRGSRKLGTRACPAGGSPFADGCLTFAAYRRLARTDDQGPRRDHQR